MDKRSWSRVCALRDGDQGKFWEFHDVLFENPDKLNRNALLELARSLRWTKKQFASCLSSGKFRPEIEQDLQDGIRAGVMGTPGIFINGTLLSGAQPEAAFEHVIESELAGAKRKACRPLTIVRCPVCQLRRAFAGCDCWILVAAFISRWAASNFPCSRRAEQENSELCNCWNQMDGAMQIVSRRGPAAQREVVLYP